MIRVSHFAAPAVVGAALFVGAAGCASHDRPDEVPDRAGMISEGRESVTATAPHDGTAYVYDDTANKLVYTSRVDKGDNLRVDAKHNRILLNDRLASERDLTNDHKFKVYFDRSDQADKAETAVHREGNTTYVQPGASGGATVIQNPNGTSTVVQPPPQQNTTVVQPAPAPAQQQQYQTTPSSTDNRSTTVVRPDGTIERHDGTR
jgi:hypothetical protein